MSMLKNLNTKQTHSLAATFQGWLALLCWSVSTLLLVLIGTLPLFETLCILFSISFLLAFARFKLSIFQSIKKIPVMLLIIGVFGIYVSNLLFLLALNHAPPEKADLINYLWPILVILFSSFLPNEKLTLKHFLGAVTAFYGVFLLLCNGEGWRGLELIYWKGYLFAFLNALCWTFFTLALKKYRQSPIELIGIICGIAAILSFVAHQCFEHFVMPSLRQCLIIVTLATTSRCLAYFFWQKGVKEGNYQLLCVLSYFNPIISIGLLVLLGFATFSTNLLTATILVSFGALIATERLHINLLWRFFVRSRKLQVIHPLNSAR